MARILLVEDDAALAMGVEFSLQQEGYEVTHTASVKETRNVMEEIKKGAIYDIALFDVMLPDGNGYDLIKAFRTEGLTLPVIFLTAVSDEVNVVQGLELGADDYITKPFRVKELMSRIKAVLRRSAAFQAQQISGEVTPISNSEMANQQMGNLQMGNQKQESKMPDVIYSSDGSMISAEARKGILTYKELKVDLDRAAVYLNEESIHLTQAEYKMLLFFLKNQGIALSRSLILERLFDDGSNFVDDNTLSVYVNRLREKIKDTRRKEPYIKTVRGVGYMMEKEHVS